MALQLASADIVNSFTGCTGAGCLARERCLLNGAARAGQRCMAASVLLTIGPQQELIDKIGDSRARNARRYVCVC
jgi:hypothetical protein